MKIKLSILVMFLLVFMHCKNTPEDFSSYRTTMLVNINTIIEDEYAQLETQVNALNQEIEAYGNTGDILHLGNARLNWIAFIKQWNKVRSFNVLDVKFNLLHTFIYSKPDAPKIEQTIIDHPNISITEVSNLGADQKGINAVEYLLFKDNDLIITDNAFNLDANSASRLNFLKRSTAEVKMQVTSLKNSWKNVYSENFLSNNDLAVGKPISEIFNQTIETITVNLKDLSQHISDNNYKTFGYYSQSELLQLKASAEGLHDLFNANEKESFSSYLVLESESEELSNKVENAFTSLITDEAFQFDSYQDINVILKENLKIKLRDLSALLSIDVSNKLMVLVTISDTDGD